ncbi:hypothetical protein AMTR_s00058p00163240, partial [Amborella trichopoda]
LPPTVIPFVNTNLLPWLNPEATYPVAQIAPSVAPTSSLPSSSLLISTPSLGANPIPLHRCPFVLHCPILHQSHPLSPSQPRPPNLSLYGSSPLPSVGWASSSKLTSPASHLPPFFFLPPLSYTSHHCYIFLTFIPWILRLSPSCPLYPLLLLPASLLPPPLRLVDLSIPSSGFTQST